MKLNSTQLLRVEDIKNGYFKPYLYTSLERYLFTNLSFISFHNNISDIEVSIVYNFREFWSNT